MLVREFDGNDYDYWCINMLTFFIGKDLWEIVEWWYEEPADWNALTANERTKKNYWKGFKIIHVLPIEVPIHRGLVQ